MHLSDDQQCPAPRSTETARDSRPAARPVSSVIPSERLLDGQTSVTIDHDGTHYVLRATRAGKLILTK